MFAEALRFGDRHFYAVCWVLSNARIPSSMFEIRMTSELVEFAQHGGILSKLESGGARLAVRLRIPGPVPGMVDGGFCSYRIY